ncbi:helix-turn-helix transcriptional regulator [Candidatus Parcubacteria bacterium]|jgi:putative transcriptional regulator|nr:helix-turn-helix transcriptional regulator [Candidatus Parcubacteria bacterium]MBT7228122.1 helix-turn-helix transcriptional regulator [Candidatus Parcubacteria bacterium]
MYDKPNNILCEIRTKKKITQEELGKVVGVSRQTIIAIEKGSYDPSVCLALKLASYFNVKVEKIFFLPCDEK